MNMSSKITNITNVSMNIATLAGLGIGTLMIMNNTKRAEKTIVISSIAMSILAIGVSMIQTEGIKEVTRKEMLESESKLKDIVLRRA